MLARLARWLRVIGMDTTFDPALDDRALVDLALAEDRVLLTRDRHLVTHLRPVTALLIRADAPLAQLQEVVESTGVQPPSSLFTRCLVCNAELRSVGPEEIAPHLPDPSFKLSGALSRCPRCGRVYWDGSHTRRMRAALARALPAWFTSTPQP